VTGHIGLAVVHSSLAFPARSIYPHEKRFAAYVFQEVPVFDERATSSIEGEK
jgi:hypothetical protein